LTINSGAFNVQGTYEYSGKAEEEMFVNGFRDNNKGMSEAEGKLLIGSWVAAVKARWTSERISIKETNKAYDESPRELIEGEKVSIYRRTERPSKFDKSRITTFYGNCYREAKWLQANKMPAKRKHESIEK
jgi:hypothetical protein